MFIFSGFCKTLFKKSAANTFIYLPPSSGTVTLLKDFAANGITHCVRPQDTTYRRAVILLRRVLPYAPRMPLPRAVKPLVKPAQALAKPYRALYEGAKGRDEAPGYFKLSVENPRSRNEGIDERDYFGGKNNSEREIVLDENKREASVETKVGIYFDSNNSQTGSGGLKFFNNGQGNALNRKLEAPVTYSSYNYVQNRHTSYAGGQKSLSSRTNINQNASAYFSSNNSQHSPQGLASNAHGETHIPNSEYTSYMSDVNNNDSVINYNLKQNDESVNAYSNNKASNAPQYNTNRSCNSPQYNTNKASNTPQCNTNTSSNSPHHKTTQRNNSLFQEDTKASSSNENIFKSVEQSLFENLYKKAGQTGQVWGQSSQTTYMGKQNENNTAQVGKQTQSTSYVGKHSDGKPHVGKHCSDRQSQGPRMPLYLRRSTHQGQHVENKGQPAMSNLNKILNADLLYSDRNQTFVDRNQIFANRNQTFFNGNTSLTEISPSLIQPIRTRAKAPPSNNNSPEERLPLYLRKCAAHGAPRARPVKVQKTNGLNLNYQLSDLNINISLFDFMKDIHFSTQL